MTAWRQLDLLKRGGGRQRGIKPPPALERETHIAIADTLRVSIVPGWIWFHPPNGGERPAFVNRHGKRVSPEGGLLARMGTRPGVSDFILAAPPRARLHALELKRRGEQPDDQQLAFLEAVRAAGGQAAWVDNYREAIEVLTGWGAVRVRVSA